MSEVVIKLPPGLNERALLRKIEHLVEQEKLMKELFGVLNTKKTWEELEEASYEQAGAY
jgi:hypothetical protein